MYVMSCVNPKPLLLEEDSTVQFKLQLIRSYKFFFQVEGEGWLYMWFCMFFCL